MADPQPARGRALSDDLPTDQWMTLRDEFAELQDRLDRSPTARWAGGTVAGLAGRTVGIGRGMVHNAEAAADALDLYGRLGFMGGGTDPSAVHQIFDIEKGLLGTASTAVTHPRKAFKTAQSALDAGQRKVNPFGTPSSKTFGGEVARNYGLGKNQGELALDVGLSAYRGPKVANLIKPTAGPKLSGVGKYLAQGFSQADAEYLEEVDSGMGHHYLRRELANKLGIPRDIQDGIFNILRPNGIDRGGMKELHYKVDPYFAGSGKAQGKAGVEWKGAKLGIKKYDPLERIWYGAPDALKVAIGGPLAMGLLMYEVDKKKKSSASSSSR